MVDGLRDPLHKQHSLFTGHHLVLLPLDHGIVIFVLQPRLLLHANAPPWHPSMRESLPPSLYYYACYGPVTAAVRPCNLLRACRCAVSNGRTRVPVGVHLLPICKVIRGGDLPCSSSMAVGYSTSLIRDWISRGRQITNANETEVCAS